jgi:hypothetical protein
MLPVDALTPQTIARLQEFDSTVVRKPVVTLDGFTLDTQAAGSLWFVDLRSIVGNGDLLQHVRGLLRAGLDAQQHDVLCGHVGVPVIGDVANMLIGVFSSATPTTGTCIGGLYVGSICAVAADEYSVRIMPYFPGLSNDDAAELTGDIFRHFLTAYPTETDPVTFANVKYVIQTGCSDEHDIRSLAHHDHILTRTEFNVAIGDTPTEQAGRIDVTLTRGAV